ncbi:MAG: 30S ribosomal protein S1 [Planctomycetota bacterium]
MNETRPGDTPDIDAKLEAEIEAALGDMSLEDMLDTGSAPAAPGAPGAKTGARAGDGPSTRTGTVVSVRGRDVIVEFGPKMQGVCPVDDFDKPPAVGERLEFTIQRYDESEQLYHLSRRGAVRKAEWESLQRGQVVEARCVGVIRGGLELMVANHKAFMPAGQVDLHFIKDISVFLNEKMACEIIEINRRRGRIVLSRRKVLAEERRQRREELLQTLEVGQKMSAVITSIQPYGAFADIGGLDGLIHISDMSYERVTKPSEVVKEGDTVDVQVLKIDRDTDRDNPRIGLGMKQCMADPFESGIGELTVGETVTGKVTRIAAFGAFVEVAPGVDGLIHISELSHERVGKVEQVVKPGEVVTAQVLSLDPQKKRISLSLKALQDRPDAPGGASFDRGEDPHMRKLKAQLGKKFSGDLKGGIG